MQADVTCIVMDCEYPSLTAVNARDEVLPRARDEAVCFVCDNRLSVGCICLHTAIGVGNATSVWENKL